MTPTPEVRERLRRYLLGQLTDDAREEIEKDLLGNDELFEELLVVEDEIIDDYLSGKLDEGERSAFEEHFLATPERHDKLRFGRAFNRYLSSQAAAVPTRQVPTSKGAWAWTQTLVSSPLRIAAFAIIVVGIAFGVWRIFFYQSEVDKGLLALNAAYRDQRPVEARISALSYAPFSQTRAANGPDHVDALARDRAELTLNNAVGDRQNDAAAHHALGEVYLAKGEFDRAIKQFEIALTMDTRNAIFYSDLGAAWLEKGKIDLTATDSGKGSEALGHSIENLSKALELNSSLLEALFNRALCHEYSGLPAAAEQDWRAYLASDPNSQWAAEARRHLRELERAKKKISQSKNEIFEEFLEASASGDDETAWRLVSSYHQRTGNLIVERLLDNYLKDQKSESKDLQLLSYVGNLEWSRAGDRSFQEIAEFYRATSAKQRQTLSEGRALMNKSYAGWGQLPVQDNLDLFRQAEKLFRQAGDSWEADVAGYWVSYCRHRDHRDADILDALNALAESCERNHHLALLVRVDYLLSGVRFNLNELSKAISVAQLTANLAERTNDAVGLLNAFTSLIEYSRYLGNGDLSLTYVQRSLPVIRSVSLDPIQGARHYGFIAIAFASIGLYAAAADYQAQAIRYAVDTKVDQVMAYNYAFLALINGKLKNYDEGLKDADLAFRIAQAHSDDAADRDYMAYASLQQGNIYRQAENCDLAISSYTRALEIYQKLNFPTHTYQAHKGRLLCYLTEKDDQRTRQEVATVIGLVENYRKQIFEENNRDTFFDGEQSVYDLAIDFEFSRLKDSNQAFQDSESSRARSLLDSTNKDALVSGQNPDIVFRTVSDSLTLSQIQTMLPEDAQIVQYAVLEAKIFTWVVSTDQAPIVVKEIDQKQLNEKVLGFLSLLSQPDNGGGDTLRASQDLFEILIAPVQPYLRKGKKLCFVPDKVLNELPFVALADPSGKFLVEDFSIVVAPSSTMYVICYRRAQALEAVAEERLLSVGNPSFDHTAFPSLSNLPAAAREANEIAHYYPSHSVLTEKDAILESVKAEMEKADVIHLALHSAVNERFPLRSMFVMAKSRVENKDDNVSQAGALSAYEIYGLNLSRTRLVALSACQTGAERYYKGEGMTSLARPFMAAGVPLVVASMWPVESNPTADLMIRFHAYRKNDRRTTADALRQAQLDMLHGADSDYQQPHYWAAFEAIGGYTRF